MNATETRTHPHPEGANGSGPQETPISSSLRHPLGRTKPYFECAVLGCQLLLQLGDLAAGVLPQLGEAALEPLHILHELRDLALLRRQLHFQAGAGQHLDGLLLQGKHHQGTERKETGNSSIWNSPDWHWECGRWNFLHPRTALWESGDNRGNKFPYLVSALERCSSESQRILFRSIYY